MEVIEGGRLKFEFQDWDFGNGRIHDWKMSGSTDVESELGSRTIHRYKV